MHIVISDRILLAVNINYGMTKHYMVICFSELGSQKENILNHFVFKFHLYYYLHEYNILKSKISIIFLHLESIHKTKASPPVVKYIVFSFCNFWLLEEGLIN